MKGTRMLRFNQNSFFDSVVGSLSFIFKIGTLFGLIGLQFGWGQQSVSKENVSKENVSARLKSLENEILNLKLEQKSRGKIKVSGSFENNYVHFDRKDPEADLIRSTEDGMISDFRINFDKDEGDRVHFYSTLNSSYFWNQRFQQANVVLDSSNNVVKGSYTFLEKAYFDYFFGSDKQFTLSVGRLPTQFGPPLHYTNFTSRSGTYPALAYSLPIDGVAFTYNLGKSMGSKNRSVFRLIYSPIFNRQNLFESDAVGRSSEFASIETTSTDSIHTNIEYSAPTALGDWLSILHFYYVEFGRAKSVDGVRGLLQSQLPNGTDDNNVYEVGSSAGNLGVLQSLVFHNEIESILGSNFDFYASYKWSRFEKKGDLSAKITEDNMSGALGSVGSIVNIGGYIYGQDYQASAALVGFRHRASNRSNYGVEYLRQAMGSAPTMVRTFRYSNFYNSIGWGYHGFFNTILAPQLVLGLGFQYVDREADYSGFKNVVKDVRQKTGYASLRYNF